MPYWYLTHETESCSENTMTLAYLRSRSCDCSDPQSIDEKLYHTPTTDLQLLSANRGLNLCRFQWPRALRTDVVRIRPPLAPGSIRP